MMISDTDGQDGPAQEPISTERSMQNLLAKYVQESLHQAHPLQGLLGCSTAQLLEQATQLHTEIQSVLSTQSDRMAAFETLAPAIEMALKLHRQAERFAQVAGKLATPGQPSADTRADQQTRRIELGAGEESNI